MVWSHPGPSVNFFMSCQSYILITKELSRVKFCLFPFQFECNSFIWTQMIFFHATAVKCTRQAGIQRLRCRLCGTVAQLHWWNLGSHPGWEQTFQRCSLIEHFYFRKYIVFDKIQHKMCFVHSLACYERTTVFWICMRGLIFHCN